MKRKLEKILLKINQSLKVGMLVKRIYGLDHGYKFSKELANDCRWLSLEIVAFNNDISIMKFIVKNGGNVNVATTD